MPDARQFAPAAGRNRGPILQVLRPLLDGSRTVLEVASGTGEHVAHFAAALPGTSFQPSDPDPAARASIDAWTAQAGAANIRPALALDAAAAEWPAVSAGMVLCINMVHISPWAATTGLMRGAARVLPPGGPLVLYGPFRQGMRHTAPSNAEFDRSLRGRDPAWGVRDLEAVAAEAAAAGFADPAVHAMPANNLCLVFERRA